MKGRADWFAERNYEPVQIHMKEKAKFGLQLSKEPRYSRSLFCTGYAACGSFDANLAFGMYIFFF